MSTPKKKAEVVQKHVALFDVHVPHNSKLDGILSYIKERKPTHLILGGDFLNLEWASHHNEKEFALIGLEKLSSMLNKELQAGREVLSRINAVLPENCNKIYLPGNHEDWLYWACMRYPQLAGGLSLGVERMTFKSDLADIRKHVLASLLKSLLKTDELGFRVLPYSKELNLGKLTYVHGHQCGSGVSSMQRLYPARNVICGHFHTEQVLTTHNSGDTRRANQYVMVPALCNLCPGYLRSSSTRWLQGFWSCDVLSNGLFAGHVVKVLDGRVIEGGRVYE